ncbi:unnamed protein product [Trichogramma brassicae]|uniref:Uncharacterized protein n=1 Tax=Trichogramma brassicae TaxID=86971 RepID=A0A6H5J8G2_9HYME|nr:unnamed protein product [Trichogramma brassicae]
MAHQSSCVALNIFASCRNIRAIFRRSSFHCRLVGLIASITASCTSDNCSTLMQSSTKKFSSTRFSKKSKFIFQSSNPTAQDASTAQAWQILFGSHSSLRTLILSDNCRDDDPANERQYSPYSIEYYTSTPKPPIEPLHHEYPQLRQLHLPNVTSYPAFQNWSQSFPRLELLDIAGNEFVVDQDRIFADLPRTLRTLSARKAGLRLHGVVLQNLLSLRELNLDGNVFEDVCDKYCAEFVRNNRIKIENLPNLEKLILSNCYIRTLHSNAFKDLAKLSVLNLSSNSILEVPNTLFDCTPRLKFLNFSHSSLASIDFLRDKTSLEILILADMKDRAPISSDVLRTQGNLKVLSLSNNALVKHQGVLSICLYSQVKYLYCTNYNILF